MSEMMMFFIGQSVVIIMTIVGTHVSTKVAIARLEVRFDGLKADHKVAREARDQLTSQVNGISRNLAAVSGELKGCPHLHSQVGGHS
jgi:hypothetical protein